MNLILIPFYWSVGAAIGTIVAECIVTITMLIIVRKDISPIKILKASIKYIIAGVVMFIGVYFTGKYLTSSILNSIILVIEGILIYGIMLLVLVDKFTIGFIKLTFNKVKIKLINK